MSAEPIVRFTLTFAQYSKLFNHARESDPLHALPDDYAKRVLIEHLHLEDAKERRKKRSTSAPRNAR